jgi:hypothetical protein
LTGSVRQPSTVAVTNRFTPTCYHNIYGDNRGRLVYIASEPGAVSALKPLTGKLQFFQVHQFKRADRSLLVAEPGQQTVGWLIRKMTRL